MVRSCWHVIVRRIILVDRRRAGLGGRGRARADQGQARPRRTCRRAKTSRPAAPARPARPRHPLAPRDEPDTSAAAQRRAHERSRRSEDRRPRWRSAGKEGGGDAGVTVVDKDGGTKQFNFSETDIEGRLKAPQLVYFLRRVRAEFAAGDLGHRSFMRELSETQRDPNF